MAMMNDRIDDERKDMLKWISACGLIIPTSDLEFLIGGIPSFGSEDDGEDAWNESAWP